MGTSTDQVRGLGHDRQLIRLAAIAVLIRLAIITVSGGSDDVVLWGRIANTVRNFGVMDTYDALFAANHPPLAMLYMAQALDWSERLGLPFPWLLKVPALVGDGLTATSIWSVVARRSGPAAARWVTIVYLFNPLTIMIVAYHGNTDALYIGLLLAATVALSRDQYAVAGALFGASLNVKLLPTLFGAAFLVLLWQRGGWLRFSGAAAAAMTPVWIVVAWSPALVISRTIGYQHPVVEPWGLTGIEVMLRVAIGAPNVSWYHMAGRVALVVAVMAAAFYARERRLSDIRTVGLVACVFLVLTPAFGVQYLALAVPFLLIEEPRVGRFYSWTGGLFLAVGYASAMPMSLPLWSIFTGTRPTFYVIVGGMVTWVVLAWAMVTLARATDSTLASNAISPTTSGTAPDGAGTDMGLTTPTSSVAYRRDGRQR